MNKEVLKILRKGVKAWQPYRGGTRIAGIFERLTERHYDDILIEDFDTDLKFSCALNQHMGAQIFWRGSYSGDQLAILETLLNPSSIFLDIGANQGEFTTFAAKRCSRVFAFEPVARNRERLLRNMKLNNFNNVTVIGHGLSDKAGELPIYGADDGYNEGVPTLFQSQGKTKLLETISLTTIDTLYRDGLLPKFDVAKIDVEGAELMVLRGARDALKASKPHLLMELSVDTCRAAGYSTEEVLDELFSMGYGVQEITKNGLTPLSSNPYCNILASPAQTS